jgi:cysteine synthase A
MKDRAAVHTLTKAYESGIINDETTIIESSSGNFGIALAMVCKQMKLHFICVIDANTNSATEKLLKTYGAEIIKSSEHDEYGGYILNRLTKVKKIVNQSKNIYWVNQYENKLNAEAYYSLADEILFELTEPDYIFVPVSSGGTITGVSHRIKEK